MRPEWLGAIVGCAVACVPGEAAPGPSAPGSPRRAQPPPMETAASEPTPSAPEAGAGSPSPPPCDAPIPVYEAGEVTDRLCPESLAARGLTAVDLSDDWVPRVLASPAGRKGPAYQEDYVTLANGELPDGPVPSPAGTAPYLNMYGVFATFGLLRELVVDEAHHACHDAVDDAALDELGIILRPWGRFLTRQRIARRNVRWLEHVLEGAVQREGVEDIAALEGHPKYGSKVIRYRREKVRVDAVRAAQAHLKCDGLLGDPPEPGVLGPTTTEALGNWQRMHSIVSFGSLDHATRQALRTDSRELAFRLVLRTLRARVVDASAILADGTAASEQGKVLGRWLDPEAFRKVSDRAPMPHAAPDRVARATEAAARAVGWTSPEATRAFFEALPPDATEGWRIAIPLPEPPSYQGPSMRLRAQIDRGDVWYEFPYTGSGSLRHRPVARRPVLILYAHDGERWVPLVRWNTTIGGWKPEQTPSGRFGLRYKESPAGRRLWRHLIAAPVWLPPRSTPDEDLLTRDPGERWRPKRELLGPGYASAYGLMMLVHHKPREPGATDTAARVVAPEEKSEDEDFIDEGIRTHGSVSYHSILRGASHGCHRLYNQLALRLGGFLLEHREHEARGPVEVRYGRALRRGGQRLRVRIDSRGYLYELTPPVPIEVTEGRIQGHRRKAPRALMPLRESLIEKAKEDAARDAP